MIFNTFLFPSRQPEYVSLWGTQRTNAGLIPEEAQWPEAEE